MAARRARAPPRKLKPPQPNRKRSPTTYDKMLGNNMRMLRLRRGLTQAALAETLGLSFQQIQKYEKGSNRLNAEKISQLATIFGVEIQTLMDTSTSPAGDGDNSGPVIDKQSFMFMENFQALSPGVRSALVGLIEELKPK